MPLNNYFAAYTKLQLRYLIAWPEIDLDLLKGPVGPEVSPISAEVFSKNVQLMIDRGELPMLTKDDFNGSGYNRAPLPACVCRIILIKLIGE